MKNPTCSQCSKVIPDGFTDCPWCGAAQASPPAILQSTNFPAKVSVYSGPDTWSGLALLLSLLMVFACGFLTIRRDEAANPLGSPAYFKGEWTAVGFWALILLVIFSFVRARRIRASSKFLILSGAGLLLSLMILSRPVRHMPVDPRQLRELGQLYKGSDSGALGKWGVAIRPLYKDLVLHNREYVEEVSKLDDALQPLYAPASFRDAASINAILDALNQRLAVADKYADIQPILSKLPTYVASVDATDREKQEFQDGFNDSFTKKLQGKNSVSAREHTWINSAIDLYKFALNHKNSYTFNSGNIVFKTSADLAVFNEKLNHSRELYAQFLQAYTATRHAQDAMLAQMGLQPSDVGLEKPQ